MFNHHTDRIGSDAKYPPGEAGEPLGACNGYASETGDSITDDTGVIFPPLGGVRPADAVARGRVVIVGGARHPNMLQLSS